MNFVGKNDPHSSVPAGFMDADGKNYALENNPVQTTIDRLCMRWISALFWQKERFLGIFSH